DIERGQVLEQIVVERAVRGDDNQRPVGLRRGRLLGGGRLLGRVRRRILVGIQEARLRIDEQVHLHAGPQRDALDAGDLVGPRLLVGGRAGALPWGLGGGGLGGFQ